MLDHEVSPSRAYVLVPILPLSSQERAGSLITRDADARLEEALNLTSAIEVVLVGGDVVDVRKPQPATLIGGGKIDELIDFIQEEAIELLVVDAALTPVQQRNLENKLKTKVIDRTGLILEIFGSRASTREGVLQVELAHLIYQKSRLVRSWTHLERQRGGAGFLGGPGERQIESDRRMLDEKIDRLRAQLADVRRTRTLHRKSRQQSPHPVVALVGYTNAGKSTLFNRLTGAGILAADQLFATLDPTLRAIELPEGTKIILSDTVGFIANLPTQLIAAFRATLEEVLEADVILHVRDAASPDFKAQYQDVLKVLDELGIKTEENDGTPVIEVLNKSDLLQVDDIALLMKQREKAVPRVVATSAYSGKGIDPLLKQIEQIMRSTDVWVSTHVPYEDGRFLAFLEAKARIEERKQAEDGWWITYKMDPVDFGRQNIH